ncbi:hypothetical protein [Rhodohalobacter sp.]|uniref:hypothetical protein n=1 Tax=Rhodohalobacter sp. TaxID=1974210 RepID=UPI002ACD6087|nr:hypothetical protein [Rhodohalobacter sp.]MDZ7757267.1 hypothetical protein [Rhodohalobacter sp.]
MNGYSVRSQTGEHGYETWPEDAHNHPKIGGANNWAGMSVDRERGIVFVPTGSAAFDFYGGNRKGANLFANSLIALNAETGERIWHFQFVHHDILDRDLPAPPNLITVTRNGQKVDAVAQITKHGYVFLFNRETGEPLFEIEERAVPPSHIQRRGLAHAAFPGETGTICPSDVNCAATSVHMQKTGMS